VFFIGIGIGAASNSIITNKIGRKRAIIACHTLMIIAMSVMVACSFTPWVFGTCTVLVGVAFGTGEIAAFVTLSEFVDTEHRNYFLGSMNATWGIAAFLTAVLYEVFGDW
jgi:MFS family permease